jgi:hypothetical protein
VRGTCIGTTEISKNLIITGQHPKGTRPQYVRPLRVDASMRVTRNITGAGLA